MELPNGFAVQKKSEFVLECKLSNLQTQQYRISRLEMLSSAKSNTDEDTVEEINSSESISTSWTMPLSVELIGLIDDVVDNGEDVENVEIRSDAMSWKSTLEQLVHSHWSLNGALH